jgi:hypothetical protein
MRPFQPRNNSRRPVIKAEREQRGRHPLQVQNEREAHERQQKKFQRDVRKNDPLFVSKKPPTVSGGLPSLGKQ